MGIRVVLRDGEHASQALKRLNELILENNRFSVYAPYSHKRSPAYYEKPSVLNRRRERVARLIRSGRGVRCLWFIGHSSYPGY
jgi:ribosomal protein S21